MLPSTHFHRIYHSPAHLAFSVPTIALNRGAGILTSFPSATHLCLTLGADSPCADERCAGNLGFAASRILTCFLATNSCIIASTASRGRYRPPSLAGNAPLPDQNVNDTLESTASVARLSPVHFRRRTSRPVSYYALFK